MIEFSDKEEEFLNELEEARIATSHDNIPHVKPVSYVFVNNSIIVATDHDTRTYKNGFLEIIHKTKAERIHIL